jgi:hypothetical protein
VTRRVGVRVALPDGRTVPEMGTVLVNSIVGVWVGSREGSGTCVGVGGKVPPGRLMNVGGGFVAVASNAVRVMTVGVGARGAKFWRTKMLNVPAQYIVSALITTIARQPYPSC